MSRKFPKIQAESTETNRCSNKNKDTHLTLEMQRKYEDLRENNKIRYQKPVNKQRREYKYYSIGH